MSSLREKLRLAAITRTDLTLTAGEALHLYSLAEAAVNHRTMPERFAAPLNQLAEMYEKS